MHHGASTDDENVMESAAILDGIFLNEGISIAVVTGTPPRIVRANNGLALLTGYTAEELYSAGPEELAVLIHPDYREVFFKRYEARIAGGDQPAFYELRIIRKSGEFRWVTAFASLIKYRGENAVVISLIDITESKNTEIALRESREQYRLLFERTPAGIFYYNRDLVITHFNRKFVELLRSTARALTGLDMYTLKDRAILPCLEMPLKGKKSFYEGPYSATTSDTRVIVSMRTEPVYGDDGSITGGVAIIEDRTRQYATEEALLESEKRFKEIIDRSPLPITVVDGESRMIYSNASSYKLFGYSTEDVPDLNTWWEKAYPDPEYRREVVDEWMEALKTLRATRQPFGPSEHRVTSADGSVHDIEFHLVPLGELAFIMMIDMTRHRMAEAELLRTKKIESLGILAGGIAHDFNNILTAILGNVSLARMELSSNDHVSGILAIVEKAAWKAKDLTQQLLTFSRGGDPVRKTISIHSALVETARFVLQGSGIKCEFDIDADLWDADADEGQIGQVIHNIVLNSRQAMADSGSLFISASNYSCGRGDPSMDKGDYIRVRVEDTGPGIPEEIVSNIFDPFFTTRSSGSGLGLAVTYSIINKHGGHITVSRGVNGGAVFEMLLPASRERSLHASEPRAVTVKSGGRILVMDDDDFVLDICARMLGKMGYTAEKAKDGEEAVRLYRNALEADRRFDCVIMDLTIPGGPGGREVVKVLKEYDPGLKAIVSSGYSNDPVMSQYRDYGFIGVTVKPYSYDELAAAVSSAISCHNDTLQ